MSALAGERQASHRAGPTDVELLWQYRAQCRGASIEVFFVKSGANSRAAKAICRRCPVVGECRAYAVEHEKYGTWGGLTQDELLHLRKMRRRMNAGAA